MLIAYAGKETGTRKNKRAGLSADRFRAGADTLQVANFYRATEASVLRWITEERSLRLGLPSPYQS